MDLRRKTFPIASNMVKHRVLVALGTEQMSAGFYRVGANESRQTTWVRRGDNRLDTPQEEAAAWLEASALDLGRSLQQIEADLPAGALETWLAAFDE